MIVSDYLSLSHIPSPEEVSSRESLLQLHPTDDWLLYGAPLDSAVGSFTELDTLLDPTAHYLLSVRQRDNRVAVMLLLLEHSSSIDLIQGILHANMVKDKLLNSTPSVELVTMRPGVFRSLSNEGGWTLCGEVVEETRGESRLQAEGIIEAMQKETSWNVGVCHFDTQPIQIERQ